MSQNSRILDYMRNHKGITAIDAMNLPSGRIMRLAARIADLRSMGHTIDTQIESYKNEDGEDVRYARYFLIKEKE